MPPIKKPTTPATPPAGSQATPPAGSEPMPPAGSEPMPPAGSEATTPAASEAITPAGSGSGSGRGRGRRASATESGGTVRRPGTLQRGGTTLDDLFCGGCGDRDILGLPSFERIEGIEPDNLRTAADAYHEGMFELIGAFRAIDELVARFLGGLNLGTVDLRNNLCNYMRQEPLRLTREDRYRVLSLFADETLERLLLRLSDAVIAFDLSRAPGGIALTPATLPEAATRLAVIEVIEELELFLDDAGGGGANFVTNEVGKQLRDILFILDDPDLRCHVAGDDIDDVFAIIAGLLASEKDRPPELEVRQMARKASFGRKIFLEIADHVEAVNNADVLAGADPDAADVFEPGELDVIGALAYQWRVAHGSLYPDVAEEADADEEAADESRLQVIRLRSRVPS